MSKPIKYYVGIGSRSTPPDICQLMTQVAVVLANNLQKQWILRSGGAKGADQVFEAGAGEHKEIFYAADAERHPTDWCMETVDQFHPAPDRLGPYARKLMARNALQILGADGKTPVSCVYCWTPGGKGGGGTGQAIRTARAFNIPVRDFGQPLMVDTALEFLKTYEPPF